MVIVMAWSYLLGLAVVGTVALVIYAAVKRKSIVAVTTHSGILVLCLFIFEIYPSQLSAFLGLFGPPLQFLYLLLEAIYRESSVKHVVASNSIISP